MLKIENKFIYFILILIFIIVSFIIYIGFFKSTVDRNSYLSLIEGTALLNQDEIFLGDKIKLSIGDIIETKKENSLVIIEWGDGSITRLGGNTSIEINNLFVSDSKDLINISFSLFSGKSRSNVLSYLSSDSYFRQSFMDYEAAVRGTVFNVDLDNDYLYVLSHQVFLTSSDGKKIEISEQKPFKLSTFEFIRLDEFIRLFKDSFFENINRTLDNEFMTYLKADLSNKIDSIKKLNSIDISKLSSDKKNDLYEKLLSNYQDLNFVDSSDGELFELKISFKEKLLSLAPDSEKENILNSLVYDFQDSIKTNSYESMNNILTIFSNNIDYIPFSDEIFLQLEKINFNNINKGLAESILKNLDKLNSSINLTSVKTIFDGIKDSFSKSFTDGLNTLFNN